MNPNWILKKLNCTFSSFLHFLFLGLPIHRLLMLKFSVDCFSAFVSSETAVLPVVTSELFPLSVSVSRGSGESTQLFVVPTLLPVSTGGSGESVYPPAASTLLPAAPPPPAFYAATSSTTSSTASGCRAVAWSSSISARGQCVRTSCLASGSALPRPPPLSKMSVPELLRRRHFPRGRPPKLCCLWEPPGVHRFCL